MAPSCDAVVVAASAGGLQPLRRMLSGLPANFPAAVLVVLHVSATGGRGLPTILDRAGPLSAAAAIDGERIRPGRIYVAPADQHLLVIKDAVRLSRGPRQNGLRPAADPLFRSAARYAGPRVTAVVLSGTLDDGALGSATVERLGGRVIVQDPAEAEYDSMPRNAIAVTEHAIAAPAAYLARELVRLTTEKPGMSPREQREPDEELIAEINGLLMGNPETNTDTREYSDLTCPECGGPLYVTQGERAVTYDCLVGHRWATESLFDEQAAAVERALWLAIRALEERGRLTGKLAEAAAQRGHSLSASQFAKAAAEAQESADMIREAAKGMTAPVAPVPGEA